MVRMEANSIEKKKKILLTQKKSVKFTHYLQSKFE